MDNIIVWNVRGIGNQRTARTAKRIIKKHDPTILVLLEPMLGNGKRVQIGLSLGFHSSYSNWDAGGKIWLFHRSSVSVSLIFKSDQCLSIVASDHNSAGPIYFTFVYARTAWKKVDSNHPIYNVLSRLKQVNKDLKSWNKEEFGNIFEQILSMERLVAELEAKMQDFSGPVDQMLSMQQDLNYNSARHASIRQVELDSGQIVENQDDIKAAAVAHFQQIFSGEPARVDQNLLQCIPHKVTQAHNEMLMAIPSISEVQFAVQSILADDAVGPDGFSAAFFQSSWEVVGHDIHRAVSIFFQ
ncbi:uncharacterized protein LOC131218169 [Magnolia sinica]|uniref:uncharacterized protein LOC131218169 n=1 Tax=Magnolia sinica TaxID=86752 RepID=UPI0026581C25|nr:uncharacterized protein LOC131218169 [Magnolia sinica]